MCQHYGIDLIKKKFGIKRNLTENPKKNLPLFLERVSMLLEAGLPIDIAFRSMSRNNSNDYFSNMATSTSERLGEGEILSVILEEENIVFDPFDIAVVTNGQYFDTIEVNGPYSNYILITYSAPWYFKE